MSVEWDTTHKRERRIVAHQLQDACDGKWAKWILVRFEDHNNAEDRVVYVDIHDLEKLPDGA